MKRLIPFLLLAFTMIQLHGQGFSSLTGMPNDCMKVLMSDTLEFGYALGSYIADSPEKASHMAYLDAMDKLNTSSFKEFIRVNPKLRVYREGAKPFDGIDTASFSSLLSALKSVVTAFGIVPERNGVPVSGVRFVSMLWLDCLSRNTDVVCEGVEEYQGDYKAFCILKQKDPSPWGILVRYLGEVQEATRDFEWDVDKLKRAIYELREKIEQEKNADR